MAQNHLVVADTMQGRWVFFQDTLTFNVVTHWTIPAGTAVNVTLANAIFSAVQTLWVARLQTFATAQQSLASLALRDIRTESMAEVSSSVPGSSGTAVGDELPPQIAAVLTVRTAQAGRKFRGRMYWPLWSATANGATGRMTSAAQLALENFAAGFIAAANQQSAQLSVTHRPTAFDAGTGLPISPGLGFSTPATQVQLRDNKWDNQRRRSH